MRLKISSVALPRAFDWLLRDRSGRRVVWQRPNLALSIWLATWLLAWPFHGVVHHLLRLVGGTALFVWAVLELFDGASPFRRSLGLIVLVLMVTWR